MEKKTTKKLTKKKTTKKKVVEKKAPVVDPTEGKIYLSEKDVSDLELSSMKLKLERTEALVLTQQLTIKEREVALLVAQHTLKLKECGELRRETENNKQQQQLVSLKKHKEFLGTIVEKYKIPTSKWGYDPISGELDF